MTVLELPFPISVNAMYRSVKGRNILSKQARQWKEQAGWMIAAQKAQKHKGPVSIEMAFTPPDKRRRDADNFVKIVLDALVTRGVVEDDNTTIIRDRRERWGAPDKQKAGVKVIVRDWE